MQGPEKNSYKEFFNEKKFLRLENSPTPTPPPPHNFCNGPCQKTAVCKDLTETGSLWHPGYSPSSVRSQKTGNKEAVR